MDYDKLRILDFRFGVCDDSGETRFGGERIKQIAVPLVIDIVGNRS